MSSRGISLSAVELPSRKDLADWVIATCLLFGAEVETALKVALVFLQGLQNEGVLLA